MSMFNDIDWTRRGNSEQCISNSEQVKNYAKKFTQGHWTFLGLGGEKKWYGKSNYLLEGKWQYTVNMMEEQFEESGHPLFKGVSPSWVLEEEETTRRPYASMRMLRTRNFYNEQLVHFANQLSIFGAVARWCEDFGMKSDETPPKTKKIRYWKKFNQKKWLLWWKHQGILSPQLETVCVKLNRTSKQW